MRIITKNEAERAVNLTPSIEGRFYMLGKDPKVDLGLVEGFLVTSINELRPASLIRDNTLASKEFIHRKRVIDAEDVADNLVELLNSVRATKLLSEPKNIIKRANAESGMAFIGEENSVDGNEIYLRHLDKDHMKNCCRRLHLKNLPTQINGTPREIIDIIANSFEAVFELEKENYRPR